MGFLLNKYDSSWWTRIKSHFKNWWQATPPAQSAESPKHPTLRIVQQQDWPTTWNGKISLTISIIRKLFFALILGFILLLGLGGGLATGYLTTIVKQESIPSYANLKNQIQKVDQSTTLYFAHHVKLARVPSDVQRQQVSIQQISPYLKKAIVATEDENFYEHHGVVPKSLLRAILGEVTGWGTQTGGSTLTQQLVKMQILSSETTWKRKAIEILLATRIEKHFSKNQILESYLNVVPLGRNNRGQNIAGAQAAAEGIFKTSAQNLSLPQAAFIAGLPQSPSLYTPFDNQGQQRQEIKLGLKRKDLVLFRMYRHGDISYRQYLAAKKVNLAQQFAPAEPAPKAKIKYNYLYNLLASQLRVQLMKQLAHDNKIKYHEVLKDQDLYQVYFQQADHLMREHDYHVYSTIDKDLYDQMQTAFKQTAANLGTVHYTNAIDPNTGKKIKVKEPVQNGSVLLNNQTGAVLGFVGGQNFQENQINHAFDTRRSPGSAIKPMLVYGPAIDNGLIGSKTMLADFQYTFGQGKNKYQPTDFGDTIANKFVAADQALEQSLNIPAVHLYSQVLQKTKPQTYMTKMGLKLSPQEYQQLGLALGGTHKGFTVAQMASAFSTFANQGQHRPAYSVEKITDVNNRTLYQHSSHPQTVFAKPTAYIMQQMMHGVIKRGTASSLTYQLDFNYKNAFGKTGTSNDFRDNWFIGSTPQLTLASWIGYDNLYGHNYNLAENSTETNQTLWANLMNSVYQTQPELFLNQKAMAQPAAVKRQQVLSRTGTLPGQITYHEYHSNVHGQMTTGLFYKTHAPNLSHEFGIGGRAKDYELFWDNYFGRRNNYGVEQQLNNPNDTIYNPDYSTVNNPDSILGNYASSIWNNNQDSTTNPEASPAIQNTSPTAPTNPNVRATTPQAQSNSSAVTPTQPHSTGETSASNSETPAERTTTDH